MATNLGPGVSRVLDPTAREFREVILQQGKPPMDAEFNLLQEMMLDVSRKGVLSGVPSGWLGNETSLLADFQTNPMWSNWFRFGRQRLGENQSVMWANVNGWLVPVMGTRTGTPPGAANDLDTTNIIALDPPPANAGDQRADFVFLEVWQARVAPNPSTANKPTSSNLYRYGNVEGGYTFLPDDLLDPSLGFESSQRVQLQYRIRVVKGPVGLSNFPDGFDTSYVKGQGAATSPTLYTFQNMRQELGDAGLWRAGDGTQNALGTVDGYVYAIPLCAVFRRNSVVWLGHPSPNLNGAINRNPTAVDRTGVKTFSVTPTLSVALTGSAVATNVTLTNIANTPLPLASLSPITIQIGDEILTYQGTTGNTLNNVLRGQAGTIPEAHPVGSVVRVLSSRPDGLFADQVASTDILDLRHVVNPNGFNYESLLRYNFDKLLKGELRANWKRSNGGTQGTLVAYQDMVSTGTSLAVSELDQPDGNRLIFSDAIVAQPFEVVIEPVTGTAPVNYNSAFDLNLEVKRIAPSTIGAAQFDNGDVLKLEIAQLKAGLGSDLDQVRWVNDVNFTVELRLDGDTYPISPLYYTVTSTNAVPTEFTANDDMLITLGDGVNSFPTVANRRMFIKVWALYGAGRGTARVSDAIHSVNLQGPSTTVLRRAASYPADNYRMDTAFAPSWSKYADLPPAGVPGPLPVTAESYVDAGSKTLVVQPFRRFSWPTTLKTMDGTAANVSTGTVFLAGTAGQTSSGFRGFTDATQNFTLSGVTVGMALIIKDGFQQGRYTITAVATASVTLDRPIHVTQTGLSYEIRTAQGLMPRFKRDGLSSKWTTTDPLGLFSGSTDGQTSSKNMYVSLPAHLIPKAGAVHVPIQPSDGATFGRGINFMFYSGTASSFADSERNFVPYLNNVSYAIFSTLNLNTPYPPAVYNGSFSRSGQNYAGIRHFSDPRGMGRTGLELPPFYGIARLFGVYEAADYRDNGSPFNSLTRQLIDPPTGAVNLLRQDVQGPTFWIEVDEDGDATFILNSACLDVSRSPNPLANFSAGDYVIEASIFGFDRDAFSEPPEEAPFNIASMTKREVRIVLTRYVSSGSTTMRTQAADTNVANRYTNNINPIAAGTTAMVAGPVSVLPAPLPASDTALFNYSRTPYGGDAWGTQTSNLDIGQLVGPLDSGTANQLATTKPDVSALTRPNEKVFEVLASLPFMTTAGTGRIAGQVSDVNPLGNLGQEDLTNYPPTNPSADRPNFYGNTFLSADFPHTYVSRYNGLTERLPLGALWRDKDFTGTYFAQHQLGQTVMGNPSLVGEFAGMAPSSSLEVTSVVRLADSSGAAGNMIVHVDGSTPDAAAPFTNFRTNRGGSGYTVSGDNPGGWVAPGIVGTMLPFNDETKVLAGVAYLVRNTVTPKGVYEGSAGDELMMMVATQVQRPTVLGYAPAVVAFSTVGVGEGNAALDYYRIEGHPLIRDNVKADLDPSTIQLAGP